MSAVDAVPDALIHSKTPQPSVTKMSSAEPKTTGLATSHTNRFGIRSSSRVAVRAVFSRSSSSASFRCCVTSARAGGSGAPSASGWLFGRGGFRKARTSGNRSPSSSGLVFSAHTATATSWNLLTRRRTADRLRGVDKRLQWITIWGFVASILCLGGIALAVAPSDVDTPRWLAVPAIALGVVAAYGMFAAIWSFWPHRGLVVEPSPTGHASSTPSLLGAADDRVAALTTYGPARNHRLAESRRDLIRAADALTGDDKGLKRRTLARELADCSDPARAVELRDQLAQESG
jgi:hypothetical protein